MNRSEQANRILYDYRHIIVIMFQIPLTDLKIILKIRFGLKITLYQKQLNAAVIQ